MEIQANPDAESLKLIVWLLIAVLSVLVVVVGFLLTFGIAWIKDSLKDFSISFTKMTAAITGLKVTVAEIKTQFDSENPLVSKRLDGHSLILDDHEGRIKVMETEHRLFHKKTCINEKD
jgi:hypothetical protein